MRVSSRPVVVELETTISTGRPAASARATLFLPRLSPVEVTYEGPNWLNEPDPAVRHAFSAVRPLSDLQAVLRGLPQPAAATIWTRLSPHDDVNQQTKDYSGWILI